MLFDGRSCHGLDQIFYKFRTVAELVGESLLQAFFFRSVGYVKARCERDESQEGKGEEQFVTYGKKCHIDLHPYLSCCC